jgi:hypothetical protein
MTIITKAHLAAITLISAIVMAFTVPAPALVRVQSRRGSGIIEFMLLAGLAVAVFVLFRKPISDFVTRVTSSVTKQF